jgi:hypothetical protein
MGARAAALTAAAVLWCTACAGATTGAGTGVPTPTPMLADGCRAGPPLAHVYTPDRLKVLDPCKHAEGVIVDVAGEDDGDHHLWFTPDPAYAYLMNPENHFQGKPSMLAEITPDCAGNPDDSAAAAKCQKTHLPIPKLGDHVAINGPWIFDSNHGWNEIHPVDSITITGP